MTVCAFSTRRRDWRFNDCAWELPNNTVIYYNFTNPSQQNCDCVCPFEGDPDIAGPGIIIGFVATAWITCLVATIDVYCRLSKSFMDRISKDGAEDSEELFQKQVQRFKYLNPRLVTFILGFFRRRDSRLGHTAKASLDILCDIQIVTSIAISLAAFVQIDTMTFYHQQFVLSYCFLTLTSFFAGRTGYVEGETNTSWYYWTRMVAQFVAVSLFAIFQAIVIPLQAETSGWNPVESGSCYISNDESSYNQQYMWMIGSFFYAGYLLLEILSGLTHVISGKPGRQTWLETISTTIKRRDERFQERYRTWIFWVLNRIDTQKLCLDAHNQEPSQQVIIRRFPTAIHYPLEAMFHLPLALWWAIHQFLALWAWGDSESTILVAAYIGFAAWDTYDILDAKISNAHLVEDESMWGFGQVLPVVLLLLVLLNIFDVVDKSPRYERVEK
ncbi:hypothetical protein HYFRA_00013141 [Hymenoscyphus fraxineus]|uniref:Uncharacterized protein n=1 Tax=Hymenoscyphus fraxineus TaxID=746836 RepID=A0A9N9PMP3_9HELO|nr:hypothetical protein HYFRA_00013141 [Hymenoscyphus fraxineus]